MSYLYQLSQQPLPVGVFAGEAVTGEWSFRSISLGERLEPRLLFHGEGVTARDDWAGFGVHREAEVTP